MFSSKSILKILLLITLAFIASLFVSQFYREENARAVEPNKWISRDEIVYNDKHYFYFGTAPANYAGEISKDTEYTKFFEDTNKLIYAVGEKAGEKWARDDEVCLHEGGDPYYGTNTPANGFLIVSGQTVTPATVTAKPTGVCAVSLKPNANLQNPDGRHSLFTRYEEDGKTPYVQNVVGGDESIFTYSKVYSTSVKKVYVKNGYEASEPCKDVIINETVGNNWYIYPVDRKSIVEDNAVYAKNLIPYFHSEALYGNPNGLSSQECRVNPSEMIGGFNLRVDGISSLEQKTEHMDDPEFPGLKNEDCDGFEAQKYTYSKYAIGCKKHEHTLGDDHVTITYISGQQKLDFYHPGGSDKNYKGYITMGPADTWFTAEGAQGRYKILSAVQTVKNQAPPDQINIPQDEEEDCGGEECDEGTQCAIEKVGWIVCPMMEFTAGVTDRAFSFLADAFLATDAELVQTGGGTYRAWQVMRDFANAAFVIAFLIIIYSQITSAGISNYGIKKMMPKLIIAAVLVNASFIICQIAVDLTNIVGYSLKDFLDSIAANVASNGNIPPDSGWNSGRLSFAEITVLILAGAGLVLVLLPLLGTILLTALITLVTIVIILLLRKALIVLLIFIAPLAFVAYLLPNTEKLFEKWKDMFIKLLMVFPIVALLFGAGNLAAQVILTAGSGGSYDEGGSNAGMTIGLVAMGVSIAPLLAVWGVLQGALAAAGAIGAKLTGAATKAGQASGKAAEGAGNKYKNSSLGKYRAENKAKRKAEIGAGVYKGRGGKWNPRNLRSRANSAIIENAPGGYGDYRKAVATETADKLWTEAVSRQKTALTNKTADELLSDLAAGKGTTEQKAAMAGLVAQKGSASQKRALIDHVAKARAANKEGYGDIQKQVAHDIGSSVPADMGETARGMLASGQLGTTSDTADLEAMAVKRFREGKFSAQSLARGNGADAQGIANALAKAKASGQLNDPKDIARLQALQKEISEFRTNAHLQGQQPADEVAVELDKITNL